MVKLSSNVSSYLFRCCKRRGLVEVVVDKHVGNVGAEVQLVVITQGLELLEF